MREVTGENPSVRLRLIRHPTQTSDFDVHPSALYMMRHVYTLLSSDISSLDLRIFRNDNSTTPDVPLNLSQSTYCTCSGR